MLDESIDRFYYLTAEHQLAILKKLPCDHALAESEAADAFIEWVNFNFGPEVAQEIERVLRINMAQHGLWMASAFTAMEFIEDLNLARDEVPQDLQEA